jgi:hypothetical protein
VAGCCEIVDREGDVKRRQGHRQSLS